MIFSEFSIVALKPNHSQFVFHRVYVILRYILCLCDTRLKICHLQSVSIPAPSTDHGEHSHAIDNCCLCGCAICAWKVFMHRLPHHIPHLFLQWFRPHSEVPCVATNLGLTLMSFSCESKPAARTSGTNCNIELQSNKSSQDFWKTASPQHAQLDCRHLFRKVSGIFPELAPELLRNFPGNSGTSPEFPELPRNFRNSPEFPELCVLPEFQGQTNSRIFFRNLPVISRISGTSRNFPGTFPELSQKFPGTFAPGNT